MVNINLEGASGITKPATKLIAVVAAAIGQWYTPTRIRREARANADASIVAAEAAVTVDAVRQRALVRQEYVEERRQENIESIAEQAVKLLPESVSDRPVDPDWVFAFVQECRDTTNVDMQALWARILAGEVTSPGKCSRRTLRIVTQMERVDAEEFSTFASLVFSTLGPRYFVLIPKAPLYEYGMDGHKLIRLTELGLIVKSPIVWETVTILNRVLLTYFETTYLLTPPEGQIQGVAVPFISLTRCGAELFAVCTPQPNLAYRDDALAQLREKFQISVEEYRPAAPANFTRPV